MNRLAFVLLLAAVACNPQPATTTPGPQLPGAPSADQAVESFLGAVRAQDLQAMSIIWGTASGPARDQIPRDELEKRELIIQCHLRHDGSRVLQERQGEAGRRIFVVELTRGSLVRTTNFQTVPGPDDRWFVETVDLEPVADLCRKDSGDR